VRQLDEGHRNQPGRRARHHRRDQPGYGPLPHRRPPGVPGEARARGDRIGRQEERQNATSHGNTYLAQILGNAATAAGRTDTFLGERYRPIARRRSAKKANVAIGRSLLVIIWHLLSDPEARCTGPGAGFYASRTDPGRRRNHVRPLEALGYTVILDRAATQSHRLRRAPPALPHAQYLPDFRSAGPTRHSARWSRPGRPSLVQVAPGKRRGRKVALQGIKLPRDADWIRPGEGRQVRHRRRAIA